MKIVVLALIFLTAWGRAYAIDASRTIICYSGGRVIYQGESDPAFAVYLGSQDDHVAFVDRLTHKFTRVGGNCIVRWSLPK